MSRGEIKALKDGLLKGLLGTAAKHESGGPPTKQQRMNNHRNPGSKSLVTKVCSLWESIKRLIKFPCLLTYINGLW